MPPDPMTPTGSGPGAVLGIEPAMPPPRLSDDSVLHEASRPGSTAREAAQAGVSAGGRMAAQHVVDVHDGLRTELLHALEILDQVRRGTMSIGSARGTLANMTIRANDWTLGGYCQAHCRALTEHHGIEDEGIFPHLRRRDPRLAPVLDRLDAEHHVIHDLIERVDRVLIDLVQDPTSYDALSDVLAVLHDAIMSHFFYEEQELLVPIARFGFYENQL